MDWEKILKIAEDKNSKDYIINYAAFKAARDGKNKEILDTHPFTGRIVAFEDRPKILQHPAVKGVAVGRCYRTNSDKFAGKKNGDKEQAHAHSLPSIQICNVMNAFSLSSVMDRGWLCFRNEAFFNDPVIQIHELAHLLDVPYSTADDGKDCHDEDWHKVLWRLAAEYGMEAAVKTESQLFYPTLPEEDRGMLDEIYVDPQDGSLRFRDSKRKLIIDYRIYVQYLRIKNKVIDFFTG